MNTLTVNLHLLMATFYRPTPERHRIVIEDAAFPSDSHAVASQARHHGFDPATAVVRLQPRDGEAALRTEDIVAELERQRGSGRARAARRRQLPHRRAASRSPQVTAAGHDIGAVVGWDLAHAVGNVPLELSAWDVDWAAWCHYKYVNAGPGRARRGVRPRAPRARRLAAAAGRLVGQRPRDALPHGAGLRAARGRRRLAGLDAARCSRSRRCARRSRSSTPSACRALRERSLRLTGYLESLLDVVVAERRRAPAHARASRRAAAASSRSRCPTRARSRRGCAPSTASSATSASPTSSGSRRRRSTRATTTAGAPPTALRELLPAR